MNNICHNETEEVVIVSLSNYDSKYKASILRQAQDGLNQADKIKQLTNVMVSLSNHEGQNKNQKPSILRQAQDGLNQADKIKQLTNVMVSLSNHEGQNKIKRLRQAQPDKME